MISTSTPADNSSFINIGSSDGFDVFQGMKQIERMFYVGDDRFSALKEISTVQVVFDFPQAKEEDPLDLLEWEYWNGRRWRELDCCYRLELEDDVFWRLGAPASKAVNRRVDGGHE